jgi:hypothetical protein
MVKAPDWNWQFRGRWLDVRLPIDGGMSSCARTEWLGQTYLLSCLSLFDRSDGLRPLERAELASRTSDGRVEMRGGHARGQSWRSGFCGNPCEPEPVKWHADIEKDSIRNAPGRSALKDAEMVGPEHFG